MASADPCDFFWELVSPLLANPNIAKGNLMGFACLRMRGEFVATPDHRTGDLIVKLPAPRVQMLIANGEGKSFAPAGKVFKEWVLLGSRDPAKWLACIEESMAFTEANDAKKQAKKSSKK